MDCDRSRGVVSCAFKCRQSASLSLCHRRPHVATDIAGRWHRNRSRVADGGQGDRWLKFSHYRRLPSLDEYLLVDLNSRATDCYRKGADGLWVLHPLARGEVVELVSFALTLTAAQLFAEVAED